MPLLTAGNTPIKFSRSGVDEHAIRRFKAEAQYHQIAIDMDGTFIGPLSVADFLNEYVPSAPTARPAGPIEFKLPKIRRQFESEFVKAINGSPFCPALEFYSTTERPDPDTPLFRRKPDICSFLKEAKVDRTIDHVMWKELQLHFEVKPRGEDPFTDPNETMSDSEKSDHEFQHQADVAHKARGQLVCYAYGQHCNQPRTHCFSVCLMGTEARLIFWDRSATVVTGRFDWVADPDTLAEFLWRYSHMSAKQRGWDTSVTPAPADKVDEARAAFVAGGHYSEDFLRDQELFDFPIHDDKTHVVHHFLSPYPTDHNASLIGRGTTGFVGYDVERKATVWIKDSWRIDEPGMEKEGEIYRRLHEHHVPNIPEFGCAGDVLVDGQPQRTVAQTFKGIKSKTTKLTAHVHYRMALYTIGLPLKTFTSTRQLCTALRDALEAHNKALSLARVLHRDVSSGNVVIGPNGCGVLIDWEFSKTLDPDQTATHRQEWRTGTWQFISGRRLKDPFKPHEVSDDLESFVHVLVYCLLKYRKTEVQTLEDQFFRLFDQRDNAKTGITVGGDGKQSFFAGHTFRMSTWRQTLAAPCADLVHGLRRMFSPLYRGEDDIDEQAYAKALGNLTNGDVVIALFNSKLGLPGWPSNDGYELVPFRRPTHEVDHPPTLKRTREEEDSVFTAYKRSKVPSLSEGVLSQASATGNTARSSTPALNPIDEAPK